MSKALCRKAINFDLDTKALKKHYPNNDYRQAYRDLKKYFIENGFEHRQWSGYVSKEKISIAKIISFTRRLTKTFPWLKKCVNRFDVTDVGEQHDLTYLITGRSKARVREVEKEAVREQKSQALFSVKQLRAKAAEISSQTRKQKNRTKSKDKDFDL